MTLTDILLIALLGYQGVKRTTASPVWHEARGRPCTTFTLQVTITADNHIYDVIHVNNNIDAVSYAQDIDTWDSFTMSERITDNIAITRTYNIHTQLCVPPNGSKKSYLQLASHGGGFDSRCYWDSEVDPEQYSYIDAALEAGYSILTYDRIGCGQSSKPDAYTDVQAPAKVEVLRVISEMVRDGTVAKMSSGHFGSGHSTTVFDKIIHVGPAAS